MPSVEFSAIKWFKDVGRWGRELVSLKPLRGTDGAER
jgi:hypothetical protein